jgi:DNA-binding LytR/AlgR family response regulator
MKIRTMIVDDEPMARAVIKKHLDKLDAFELVKSCDNAIEAINFLQKETADLIFLDIQMPELTGLEFLKSTTNPPFIVLATAYSDYGVESYEYERVIDYLLKPITFERFLKTANRIYAKFKIESQIEAAKEPPVATPPEVENLYLKADKRIHKVNIADILYLQGFGNYVKVFTKTQGMIMVLQKLQEFEETLPVKKFVRTHKSFIVSVESVSTLEGNRLFIGKTEIPIGITHKKTVDDMMRVR